jgi:hypothetical protein
VGARIAIAVALFLILAGVAWWLERRRRAQPPPRDVTATPGQLDRNDFARPAADWLVVLFTSTTCDSCQGLYDKARPLESDDVAVTEVEFSANNALHERYRVNAAPMTLIADHDGVVHGSFLGTFSATDLWNKVAELRAHEGG